MNCHSGSHYFVNQIVLGGLVSLFYAYNSMYFGQDIPKEKAPHFIIFITVYISDSGSGRDFMQR